MLQQRGVRVLQFISDIFTDYGYLLQVTPNPSLRWLYTLRKSVPTLLVSYSPLELSFMANLCVNSTSYLPQDDRLSSLKFSAYILVLWKQSSQQADDVYSIVDIVGRQVEPKEMLGIQAEFFRAFNDLYRSRKVSCLAEPGKVVENLPRIAVVIVDVSLSFASPTSDINITFQTLKAILRLRRRFHTQNFWTQPSRDSHSFMEHRVGRSISSLVRS